MNPPAMHEALDYEHHPIHPRLECFKPHGAKIRLTFAQEVSRSLDAKPRSLNPRFFYDETGSSLFEEICTLPEYYLSRAETGLLRRVRDELASYVTNDMRLVELGSGSSVKTRIILDAFEGVQERTEYIPIDVSDILKDGCAQLLDEYDGLCVTGVIDEYEGGLEFVRSLGGAPNMIAFLGSSLGNFGADDGVAFLGSIGHSMGDGDHLLMGLDLVKDKGVLERAYNDSRGVTARFNLNLLSRINSELGADFDLSKFAHHAIFNEDERRIEMYLKSTADQSVSIPGSNMKIDLRKDELIHTEYSYKYDTTQIEKMLSRAKLYLEKVWRDEKNGYALVMCSKLRRPART